MELARKLVPSWINGLADYSCTIHSAGVSFWSAIGNEFGHESYSELPAPQNGSYAFVGTDVRSDSVWFDRNSGEPVTIVEFERYSVIIDAPKLQQKTGNLLLAHHRWEQRAKHVVLAYWTKSLADLPDHAQLIRIFLRGFRTSSMESVSGCSEARLSFFQFMLRQSDSGLWQLAQIRQRGTA